MPAATNPIISVRGVSFSYEGASTYALKDVNLDISSGEFVAFVGQNGAGKTTLAKLFNGLLEPTEGQVVIDGNDTGTVGLEVLARTVGYCYQNPDHQIFARTVKDEVAFGPKNLDMTSDEVEEAVEQALQLVGMEDMADTPPFLLGRGQRQKLAVASVIAMGSPILVVDEPTTGLDLRGTLSIMDLLRTWNADGRTIIIITHDMNVVAEYAERTIVMVNGQKLADGPTRKILSDQETLAEAYLKAPQVTRVAQQLEPELHVPCDVLTVEEMLATIKERLAVNV